MERHITDDIDELKLVLPTFINNALDELGDTDNLLEIVLDIGRLPSARFVDREVPLSYTEVTRGNIDAIVDDIGDFDADNRAGMERTLHRISAIRNRRGDIIGLTCRVGRIAKASPRIVQVRTRRPFRDTEHGADLGVLEPFNVVQNDHRALPGGQVGERGVEPCPQIFRFRRIAERRRNGFGEFLRFANLSAARQIERCVGDDAVEPGPECLVGPEAIKRAIGVQECFLYGVFCVLVVEHDTAGNGVRPPLMALNQPAERVIIPTLGGDDPRPFLVDIATHTRRCL
jgi:hypothetical protein